MGIPADRRRLYSFFCLLGSGRGYPPSDGLSGGRSYFPTVRPEEVRDCWRRGLAAARRPGPARPLSLRLRAGSPGNAVRGLLDEMEAHAELFEGAAFSSAALAGGGPEPLSDAELDAVLRGAAEAFTLAGGAELRFETSAGGLTDARLDLLERRGVNSVAFSVGVRAEAEGAWARLAARPGFSRELRMAAEAGPPAEGAFLGDLGWAVGWAPEAIRLLPGAAAAAQGGLPRLRLVLETAERFLARHGYRRRADGADGAGSRLGLGPGARSHAWAAGWYEQDPAGAGPPGPGLPRRRMLPSDELEEARARCLRDLSDAGRLERQAFRGEFGREPEDFPGLGPALRDLQAEGILELGPRELSLREASTRVFVLLKHLYGPGVEGRLLSQHAALWEAFCRDHRGESPGLYSALHQRAEAPVLPRVYLRAAA